jgi:osmotically inducible lipoprotein OsmB
MPVLKVFGFVAAAALLSACGDTVEESAATGGLAGAAVGGPVGAVVGAGAGAAAEALPEVPDPD